MSLGLSLLAAGVFVTIGYLFFRRLFFESCGVQNALIIYRLEDDKVRIIKFARFPDKGLTVWPWQSCIRFCLKTFSINITPSESIMTKDGQLIDPMMTFEIDFPTENRVQLEKVFFTWFNDDWEHIQASIKIVITSIIANLTADKTADEILNNYDDYREQAVRAVKVFVDDLHLVLKKVHSPHLVKD
jgi:uncharacterized membrane protein YqiK